MSNVWQARRQYLRDYLRQNGIDAALITSPANVYYLTGFQCNPHERFMALCIEAESGVENLYMPLLDLASAKESASVRNMVPISDGEDAYELLKQHTEQALLKLGVEKNAITLAKAEKLMDTFANVALVDLEEVLLSLRMKKSEEEIVKVRRAVDIVEKVVAHAAKIAVPGMTELELTAELEYEMRKLGADRPAFESIVLTGARTALPHGTPGPYPIKEGDFVLIDIGVEAGGYCSDITRTFVMGEPTEEQRKLYETVLAGNMAAIEAARAGVPLSAVDKAARDVITAAGYGPLFTHRVGHGFGMEVHEQPSVSGSNDTLIETGLLFTIEPGIYDDMIGGVRIEDDVYIKQDGSVEVLTSYPKALTSLNAGSCSGS